jgi:hypothetical protein
VPVTYTKALPSDGGCWYCHERFTDDLALFSTEFDTYVHRGCLITARRDDSDNEAKIMFDELIKPKEV